MKRTLPHLIALTALGATLACSTSTAKNDAGAQGPGPQIDSVTGNGYSGRVHDGIIVTGSHLAGGTVKIGNGANSALLVTDSSSDTRIAAHFAAKIDPVASATLTVTTSSGSATAPVQVLQGEIGATGAKGDVGADGAAGANGATGPAGATGATGAAGAAGVTGPAGVASSVPGPTGPAGSAGAPGPTGAGISAVLLRWSVGNLDLGYAAATATKIATLSNVGTAPAAGVTVTSTAGFLATPDSTCTTLAPNGSCNVTIGLDPDGGWMPREGVAASLSGGAAGAILYLTGQLNPAGTGADAAHAAPSCRAIKDANPGATDGTYWIDPDGPTGAIAPYLGYCDMSTGYNGAFGGWTLVASTMIPWRGQSVSYFLGMIPVPNNGTTVYDTVWSAGAPYPDLGTLRPSNQALIVMNAIPFSTLKEFRFTCYANGTVNTFGIDWIFPLSSGNNRQLMNDLYDDARLNVYAKGLLTQSNGTIRMIGYDNAQSRADWGLGSVGTDGAYWAHESWGQVDSWGGHCEDPGESHTTNTLSGTGQYHIWVR